MHDDISDSRRGIPKSGTVTGLDFQAREHLHEALHRFPWPSELIDGMTAMHDREEVATERQIKIGMEWPVAIPQQASVASRATITVGLKSGPDVARQNSAEQIGPIVSNPPGESGSISEVVGENHLPDE